MSGAYSTLVRMMLLYATSEHSRYLHSDYHLLRRTTEMNRFLHWLFHIQFVTPMCLIEVSLMHRKMIMTTVRVGRCHTPITLVCVCDTDRHVLTWHIKATLICPRNDIKHTRMHSAAGGLPPPPDALAAYSASQIPWLGLGRGEEENGGKWQMIEEWGRKRQRGARGREKGRRGEESEGKGRANESNWYGEIESSGWTIHFLQELLSVLLLSTTSHTVVKSFQLH